MAQEEVIQTVRETPEIEAYRIVYLICKETADQGITYQHNKCRPHGSSRAARRQRSRCWRIAIC